jgi:hypothetical protein
MSGPDNARRSIADGPCVFEVFSAIASPPNHFTTYPLDAIGKPPLGLDK